MVLETEFERMENSRGEPGGPNTTGWAREPPHRLQDLHCRQARVRVDKTGSGTSNQLNQAKLRTTKLYSGVVARTRKAELDELGIIFDSNSVAKARPGLPGIVSRTIAQPADLELKIAGQRATVVGVAVLARGSGR